MNNTCSVINLDEFFILQHEQPAVGDVVLCGLGRVAGRWESSKRSVSAGSGSGDSPARLETHELTPGALAPSTAPPAR